MSMSKAGRFGGVAPMGGEGGIESWHLEERCYIKLMLYKLMVIVNSGFRQRPMKRLATGHSLSSEWEKKRRLDHLQFLRCCLALGR